VNEVGAGGIQASHREKATGEEGYAKARKLNWSISGPGAGLGHELDIERGAAQKSRRGTGQGQKLWTHDAEQR
jgi:hypothetical protein